MATVPQTLCLVYTQEQILLGMKKRGFGAGRWNGFGGKAKADETPEAAARRELLEEACLTPLDLKSRGVLAFEFEGQADILEVKLFSCGHFNGEPKETEEMRPQWFALSEIPYKEMWPDDIFWLPLVLQGKNVEGKFLFKDKDTILKHNVKIIWFPKYQNH